LAQEGFVASSPNRGTIVLPFTEEELFQVLVPVRLVLERFAFRLAMETAKTELLEPFEASLLHMRNAAGRSDRYDLAEADISFHRAVFTLAGNHHSLSIWNAVAPRAKAYFVQYPQTTDMMQTVRDHELLLEILRERRVAMLDETLTSHIQISPLKPLST
jgi:DNA-binding GntR family transcriptional regulator